MFFSTAAVVATLASVAVAAPASPTATDPADVYAAQATALTQSPTSKVKGKAFDRYVSIVWNLFFVCPTGSCLIAPFGARDKAFHSSSILFRKTEMLTLKCSSGLRIPIMTWLRRIVSRSLYSTCNITN
jgi:hypothetical protein